MRFTILALAALAITTSSYAKSRVCHTVISRGPMEFLNTNYVRVPGYTDVVLAEYKNIKTTIENRKPHIYFKDMLIAGSDVITSVVDLNLAAHIINDKGNEYDVLVECSQ